MMWIEALAWAVLWVALVLAVVTRMQHRRPAILLGAAGIGGLWLLSVLATVSMGLLAPYIGWGLFVWDLSWAVAYTAAAIIVCVVGLRSVGEAPPRAAAWPRGRIALAFAGVLVLYYITFWNLDLAMQSRLEGIRAEAAGRALSVAPAPLPPDQNAAPLYRDAFTIFAEADDPPERWNTEWTKWLHWDEPLELDASNPDLVAYVEAMAPAAALARAAAAKPGCHFDRDYGRPSIDMLLPELSGFRKAAQLLAVSARVKAAGGHPDEALADLEALFRITRHVEQEPILISGLVAMANDCYAVRTLEALLADGTVPVETLALAPTQFYNETLSQAFRMEEAFGLTIFANLALGDPPTVAGLRVSASGLGGPERILGWPLLEWTGCAAAYRVFVLPADMSFYRRAMHRYQNVTAMPYHQARAEWERMEKELYRGEEMGILSRLLFPALSSVAKTAATADARRALARLALAMERCRAEAGAYPEGLDAVAPAHIPAVPRDPFDGKPLRLVRREGHLVLYSVGKDVKDDGGTPWDEEAKTGDLVFRLTLRSTGASD
jgi:hypothetical protein